MRTVDEWVMELARQRRERLAKLREAQQDITEIERVALQEAIFKALHPLRDWHDDKPEHNYADTPSQAELQEARYGVACDPWSWKP